MAARSPPSPSRRSWASRRTCKVTHVDGQYKFSLLSPGRDPALAMIPASFGNVSLQSKKMAAPMTFGAGGAQATTRFVLANSKPGYDASPTF